MQVNLKMSLSSSFKALGPVVRTSVSANPGLNFNPGFFFFSLKALSQIIFYILFKVSNHQILIQAKRIKLNLFLKLSYLSSNFARLTLGNDLNPCSFEQPQPRTVHNPYR